MEYDDIMAARKMLGFAEDEILILTVADNQERKNLWANMRAVKDLKDRGYKVRFILVTREHNPFGYRLMELAQTCGISNELVIFERGMPADKLTVLYGVSDIFLLLSKGEGLSMPTLEAMASGLPVVVSDTGALSELVGESQRGLLVDSEYEFIDVWGNSLRFMADPRIAATQMQKLVEYPIIAEGVAGSARRWIEDERNPVDTVSQLIAKLKELGCE
jgi:glycosyltransferase involved in cell wall biosynthesis